MQKYFTNDRLIEFVGNTNNHSIVIGNYGNARVIIKGQFDLEGMIYCPGRKVEIFVDGCGQVKFTGTCKELIISHIQGNCRVDMGEFVAKIARCERVEAPAKLVLGFIRSLEIVSVDIQAVLEYRAQPAIVNHSLLRVA